MAARVQRFQASVGFDRRLADADIDGSLAHARMLAAPGVIARDDLAAIERGMREIRADIRAGRFAWSVADEDVHLNIEKRLTALVGDAGKRLHTGRSRNDQVATDLRLWLRGEIDATAGRLRRLRTALVDLAERHCRNDHARIHAPAGRAAGDLRPSPARLRGDARARQRAARRLPPARQPAAARQRRARRHRAIRSTATRVARELGFEALCANSLDAVSDRDFAIEFAAVASLVMVHLSRFAEELVLWSIAALRLRHARRPLLHRQLDHAAEEESRRARARARQVGAACSATSSRCSR